MLRTITLRMSVQLLQKTQTSLRILGRLQSDIITLVIVHSDIITLVTVQFFLWPLTSTVTGQLILNRKCYQVSKPEMELLMIHEIHAALLMHAKTEKTKFFMQRRLLQSFTYVLEWRPGTCTLTKHTRRWTYSALRHFFQVSPNNEIEQNCPNRNSGIIIIQTNP